MLIMVGGARKAVKATNARRKQEEGKNNKRQPDRILPAPQFLPKREAQDIIDSNGHT